MSCPDKEMPEEEFGDKMMQVLNNSALSMGIAIGDQVGLFKTLSKLEGPKTSAQIASECGLNERYVREWLGIMVTGGVIHADRKADNTTQYFLPRNYIKFLTPGFESISHQFKWLMMLAGVSDKVENCFRNGGGIPYSSYPAFHAWMNEYSEKRHEALLLQHHVPSIDGLTARLDAGITCLDIGCGMGSPSLLMAKAFPNSEFWGYDVSDVCVEQANEKARSKGLSNAKFAAKNCSEIGNDDNIAVFDFITAFDAVHDQARPDKVLAAAFRLLKPDGWFSLVDVKAHSNPIDNIGIPMSSMKYTESLFHCMPVSLYFQDGAGLGTCWGQELATEMLKKAGFTSVKIIEFPGDDYNYHILCRK
eukprot:gene12706-14011_t